MAIPDGWTDDMTIPLPPGLAVEDIVELVLQARSEGVEYEKIIEKLASLGLSEEDACLAYDRTLGGRARAETGSMENEPQKDKDPIAWVSFHRNLEKAPASEASSNHAYPVTTQSKRSGNVGKRAPATAVRQTEGGAGVIRRPCAPECSAVTVRRWTLQGASIGRGARLGSSHWYAAGFPPAKYDHEGLVTVPAGRPEINAAPTASGSPGSVVTSTVAVSKPAPSFRPGSSSNGPRFTT